jgi:hypothetical protein
MDLGGSEVLSVEDVNIYKISVYLDVMPRYLQEHNTVLQLT